MKQLSAQILFVILSKIRFILRGRVKEILRLIRLSYHSLHIKLKNKMTSFFRRFSLNVGFRQPTFFHTFLLLMTLFVGLTVTSSAQTIIQLTPVADTYLDASNSTTNYGTTTFFSIEGENTRLKRALLKFDLSTLPSNATIVSASLVLQKVGTDVTANDVSVYRMGTTTPAQNWTETGASWDKYTGSSSWTVSGANSDIFATPYATTSVSANGSYSWTVTSLVNDWVNNSIANNGIMLRANPEQSGNQPLFDFNSKQAASNQPVLVITYSLPTYPGGVSTGLLQWLRADAGTTIATGVSVWADQSVPTRNATQAMGSNQPILTQNSLNFNPTLVFNGSSQFMQFSDAGMVSGASPRSTFAVAMTGVADASNRYLTHYGTGATGQSSALIKNTTNDEATAGWAANHVVATAKVDRGLAPETMPASENCIN